MSVFKKVNQDFFKTWTPEMAYVLGFIFADGYVQRNNNGGEYLGLVSTDREIVEKMRSALDSDHLVGVRRSTRTSQKELYRLQIGSRAICSDLRLFDVVPNKSLSICLPESTPRGSLPHFVRGYFDGDGCIYFAHVRVRGELRPCLQLKFTSGSHPFLQQLLDLLRLENVVHGGSTSRKERGCELGFSKNDGLALCQFMYNNTPNNLFLVRKYKIFERVIEEFGMQS